MSEGLSSSETGVNPTTTEAQIPRPAKPWGEKMYEAAKRDLAQAVDDEEQGERAAYLKANIERYEQKRREGIKSVFQRLEDAEEVGDEEGAGRLREWLDGTNRAGDRNARSSELYDISKDKLAGVPQATGVGESSMSTPTPEVKTSIPEKRREGIKSVFKRLGDAEEVGDEEETERLREWLDGTNRAGKPNALPSESYDILNAKPVASPEAKTSARPVQPVIVGPVPAPERDLRRKLGEMPTVVVSPKLK